MCLQYMKSYKLIPTIIILIMVWLGLPCGKLYQQHQAFFKRLRDAISLQYNQVIFIHPLFFSFRGDRLKNQVQHPAKVSPWTHITTNFAQKNAPASCR